MQDSETKWAPNRDGTEQTIEGFDRTAGTAGGQSDDSQALEKSTNPLLVPSFTSSV
jgi:hypothetical protein